MKKLEHKSLVFPKSQCFTVWRKQERFKPTVCCKINSDFILNKENLSFSIKLMNCQHCDYS